MGEREREGKKERGREGKRERHTKSHVEVGKNFHKRVVERERKREGERKRHSRTHAHSHTRAPAHAHIHTYTHTHAHTHTHTHTHAHTHMWKSGAASANGPPEKPMAAKASAAATPLGIALHSFIISSSVCQLHSREVRAACRFSKVSSKVSLSRAWVWVVKGQMGW